MAMQFPQAQPSQAIKDKVMAHVYNDGNKPNLHKKASFMKKIYMPIAVFAIMAVGVFFIGKNNNNPTPVLVTDNTQYVEQMELELDELESTIDDLLAITDEETNLYF